MSGPRQGDYTDPDVPLADRVEDLLAKLTTAEKIGLLHQHQAPVPRLGVGAFRTGTEALHGLAWLGPATVFPQAVGLAASWDPELLRRVGAATGDEVRGYHHKDPGGAGLNVWAPVVNPLRDPRWGRNEEGYAEDPWLTGVMGTAYAAGLRGDHPTYLRTAPTLKHFLAYNNEDDRHLTSSDLPPRVLREYELPAFRAPIAAGAAVAVMASYNLVNGRPAHLSPLINDELRRWTDEEVLLVGDAYAVSNIAGDQRYHPDHVAGFAAALRAGVDCCTEDDDRPDRTVELLTEALRRGLITESQVDAAARRSLSIRFRLGEFDPAGRNPYAGVTADVINCPAHQDLARTAARASIVLLRHDGETLPLRTDRDRRVAVIGPLADTVLTDWYSGTLPYQVSAFAGLTARLGESATLHREGVDRVALRCAATGRPVVADSGPAGGPLVLGDPGPMDDSTDGTGFDLIDWGRDIVVLRAAANGRHVRATEDATLVNDRPGPGEWVVRETFTLVTVAAGTVLRHLATDRYVVAGADGTLRAEATDPAAATAFEMVVLHDGVAAAATAAAQSDIAVVVLGNHPMVNGRETEDRIDLALPAGQDRLLRAVHAANPRTVLVLASGYPYAVGWADEHLPAVLWSAHGGQEYGHALADVLLGADSRGRPVDPAGRLTQTWYADSADLPEPLDYDVIDADATYLYFRGDPLYPFGHGCSYTTFDYTDLRLSADRVDADGSVTVEVDVVNVGERAGTEVVQLYTRQRRSRVKQPLRQLRGFARLWLAPGERGTVRLALHAADLAFWDVTRDRFVVESAAHTVAVGSSCVDLRLTARLDVRGERVPPRTAAVLRAVAADEWAGVRPVPCETESPEEAMRSVRPGAWLGFRQVDLGEGSWTPHVRLAVTPRPDGPAPRLDGPAPRLDGPAPRLDGPAPPPDGPAPRPVDPAPAVTLRLDDPVSGPAVGPVSPTTVAGWTEVTLPPLPPAAGTRNVYLVCEGGGITVDAVRFDPADRATAPSDVTTVPPEGTAAPSHHGTAAPSHHGTAAPSHHGTAAPSHRTAAPLEGEAG